MSNRTRSILKAMAVIVVLLCLTMHMHWVIIPAISAYTFWLMITDFGLLLISSK